MNIERLRRLHSTGRHGLRITTHAKVEARKDGLTQGDLEHAFWHGEVVEDYGVRALVLDFTRADDLPCHVVFEGSAAKREVVVVSAYVPDSDLWERDWKTRT